ncbi:MAG: glycosyltransferase family 39 protein [Bacteroidales bacterium]|nr:glycosyltransferase family 39 protein [Bacteroidales bacterium]MCB9013882.1 glycosyltransferase family 39 protein [Bacteroidales bacterium]
MHKIHFDRNALYIILIGLLLFIPFLGTGHLFDWDEINFAESAREMIVSGDYLTVQINYLPFWEKPPLFIWMQVASMKIFGINEFAARFPNAMAGIFSLLVLFYTGKKFRDESFGWLWVLSFCGSLLPFMYFKSGIIDPWFNLFIFIGIIQFIYYLEEKHLRLKRLVLSAFFLGLAVLTKGPVALLIFLLSFTVYMLIVRFRIQTKFSHVLLFIFVLSVTGGFWFILQIASGNLNIIRDFIVYQIRLFSTKDAGHGGFLLYHFVVLLLGVFPASLFAFRSFFKKEPDREGRSGFSLWMQILFFVVLILFTIVKTKIVHYSSMCYFPLSFIAAITLYKIVKGELKAGPVMKFFLALFPLLYGSLVIAASQIDRYKGWIIDQSWIHDEFAIGNLQAFGKWGWFEAFIGLFFIISTLVFISIFKRHIQLSIRGIFLSTMVFGFLLMGFVVPRVESYSQRAAIDFYQLVKDEDAYITTLGFKSYAQFFYGEVKPPENKLVYQRGWLIYGNIDKPVYIVFKINRMEKYLEEHPEFKVLSIKNGFVFARRDPPDLSAGESPKD